MEKSQILLVVGVMFVASGLALECYVCDTDDDGNKCKEKDPKTDKLDRYISDDKDTCYACSKITYDDSGDKRTLRGCINKDTYSDNDVKKDKCKTVSYGGDDDAEWCVCDSDKCNGGQHVAGSMATIVLALIAKHLF